MRSLFLFLLALLARMVARPSSGQLRRLLILKPDALGDLLLATPALHALRQALPAAHITALIGPWSRVMWAHNPDLDALHTLAFPGFGAAPGQKRRLQAWVQPYWLLLRYALLLRRAEYDAALLLRDDHWWGAALVALAGIPIRVGHAHPLCAPFLTLALPYDPAEHVSRQSLAVVSGLLQRPCSRPSLRFEPSPADRAWASTWLRTHLAPDERFVVIHPGASGPTKAWPAERWAAVGDLLWQRGWRVVLTGGPDEVALAVQVATQMQHPALNLAGATSIGQLAAIMGAATLTIGGDTGPLHIAVSQGHPSIHLFGPSDPARFGPWGDPARHRVLTADLPCRPCSHFHACPRHTDPAECMASISLDQVVQALDLALVSG